MKTINLMGLRVLNTRPIPQANQLNAELLAANARPLSCPAFEIKPTKTLWFDKLPDLSTVDQAIFISANAVSYSLSYLKQNNISLPKTIKITAIGQATALKLKEYGIEADNMPTIYDSEHLLNLRAFSDIKNQTILLFKGEGGRQLLESTLQERGANLYILPVYQRVLPKINPALLSQWWQEQAVDIILFTSQQAMENIFQLFGVAARPWLLKTPCLVISQRLADIASSLGMQKIIISSTDSIIETLDQAKGRAYDRQSGTNNSN